MIRISPWVPIAGYVSVIARNWRRPNLDTVEDIDRELVVLDDLGIGFISTVGFLLTCAIVVPWMFGR